MPEKLLLLIETCRAVSAAFESLPDDGDEEEAQALCEAEGRWLDMIADALPLGPERRPRAVVLPDGAIVCAMDAGVAIVEPGRVERIGGEK